MNDRGQQPGSSLTEQLAAGFRRRSRSVPRRPWRVGELQIASIVLMVIPIVTVLAGTLLSLDLDRGNRRLANALAPRIAALDAARAAIALQHTGTPLFTFPTVSHVLTRMSEKLPPNARVHMLSIDRHGRIVAQIDCNDPDALLSAFRSDTLLGGLQMVGQAPAEQGVRVSLRQPDR